MSMKFTIKVVNLAFHLKLAIKILALFVGGRHLIMPCSGQLY